MNGTVLVELVVLVAAAVLAIPALVYTVQCLLGSLPWRHRSPPTPAKPFRVAVLIPAHNEAAGIGATVANVLPQLAAGDRLVVVADNCSDDTAGAAKAAASTVATAGTLLVVERHDDQQRGKGYALAFGKEQLASDPPDVLVCIDADCRVATGSVRDLGAWAITRQRPVQADYLLVAPATAGTFAPIGAFAILVRNRVRPRGMAKLGLPCQITGSGMALPWTQTHTTAGLDANIVEDLVMGLKAALTGQPPLALPEVQVRSELPTRDQDAEKQRRRWEHGQMATALAYTPRLLFAGLRQASLPRVALALDLCVPPMALLVMLLLALFAASLLLWWATGAYTPLGIAGASLAAVSLGTLVAWWTNARDTLPWQTVVKIPGYVLWKVPLYLGFVKNREQAWRRTRRDGEAPR